MDDQGGDQPGLILGVETCTKEWQKPGRARMSLGLPRAVGLSPHHPARRNPHRPRWGRRLRKLVRMLQAQDMEHFRDVFDAYVRQGFSKGGPPGRLGGMAWTIWI